MGDMADYYLDLHFDEQFHDPSDEDPEGKYDPCYVVARALSRPKPKILRCRYCKQDKVEWKQEKDGKWRLYNIGESQHNCEEYFKAKDNAKHGTKS